MTTFSDEKYDYFWTSDGCLYRAPRNLEREAAEARFHRSMYWVNLMNRALLYGAVAFCSADLTLLALLLGFGGA